MYMHVNIACLFILDIISFVFIMTFMTSTISLIFTCICIKDSGIWVCIYKFNRLMRYLYKCITCFLNILSSWFNVPDTCVYLYTWTCVFMMYIIGRVCEVVFLQHFISKKSNPSISFFLERLISFNLFFVIAVTDQNRPFFLVLYCVILILRKEQMFLYICTHIWVCAQICVLNFSECTMLNWLN